jgi:hypothetical protein
MVHIFGILLETLSSDLVHFHITISLGNGNQGNSFNIEKHYEGARSD